MKRMVAILVCCLLLSVLAVPSLAAPDKPQITLQPQNYHYPQYGTAIYTVKATGSNLSVTWYLSYEGKTYNISDNTNGMEPWEAYAGETYGPIQNDDNTFSCFFGGIEEQLNGAQIWCVIEDGHYDVTSEKAVITVQGESSPPEILEIPASVSVKCGQEAELRCIAKANGEAQLSFQWYETTTGKLSDISAIDAEDADFLICNTKTAGTYYYVCCVTASDGGRAYSSVVKLTVEDKEVSQEPQPTQPPDTETTVTDTEPTETTPAETAPAASAPAENVTVASDISAPQKQEENGGVQGWVLVLVSLAAAGAGVGIAFLLIRKKS